MGKFSTYKVELKGLSPGKHQLSFDLTDSFFALINEEESDVKRGNLKLVLDINRIGDVFEMIFSINGVVLVSCDRCLDDIEMPVNINNKIFVKFGEEYTEESDEVVVIPESEGNINIAWFVYEFIILSLPIKRVHAYGMCNKEMLTKLKKHKTYIKNSEESESETDDDDDMDMDIDFEENNKEETID